MSNNRIFYPVHQAGIKADGVASYTEIHGLQTTSTSTTFNLEQVFELGQLAIYENIEEIPDVEVSLTKVLDGYPPMMTLATSAAADPLLQTRANEKCLFAMSIFDDTVSSTQGATVQTVVESSGMYVGSVSYSFPLDDNMTEDITLVGNDRIWKGDSRISNVSDSGRAAALTFAGAFDGSDSPSSAAGVGRRQDLLMTQTGTVLADGIIAEQETSVFPIDMFGISSNGENTLTSATRAHLSNASVSVDLNREPINELGRKAPYFRSANFPVEVTTEFEVTAVSGDFISATEGGILSDGASCTNDNNTADTTIRLSVCEGLRLYMGNKNRLSSTNYGGGDAGGGNVSLSYSYTTFNHLTVMHTNDPNAANAFDPTNAAGLVYLTGAGGI